MLKAHVGVALLSGFGSANVDKGDPSAAGSKEEGKKSDASKFRKKKAPAVNELAVDYQKLHVSAIKKKVSDRHGDIERLPSAVHCALVATEFPCMRS